jgi:glucoamylase
MADDVTHALIRSQQVISLSGNVLTGGIEEAVFDVYLNMIQDDAARIGSPAAGEWLRSICCFRGDY